MSRVGKKAVTAPKGVTVRLDGKTLVMKGPKGELKFTVPDLVSVKIDGDSIAVANENDTKESRALWGTSRAQIANLVKGVTQGFEKKLEISGVGYRAAMQGKTLKLSLGYSHDIDYVAPDGVTVATTKPTEIVVSGFDKQRVGQVAAEIRGYRPPEPYKGKGVKYSDEKIFRKEGKKK